MLWNSGWQTVAHNNYQVFLSFLLLFLELGETGKEENAGWKERDYRRGMNLRDASKF